MKYLPRPLRSAKLVEYILPLLVLNVYIIFALPHAFALILQQSHSLLITYLALVLAVILANLYYFAWFLLGRVFISAAEVAPEAMIQAQLNRPAIVILHHVPTVGKVLNKVSLNFAKSHQDTPKRTSSYPPVQLTPFSALPYELFHFSPVLLQ